MEGTWNPKATAEGADSQAERINSGQTQIGRGVGKGKQGPSQFLQALQEQLFASSLTPVSIEGVIPTARVAQNPYIYFCKL